MPPKFVRRAPKPKPYSFRLEIEGAVCARFEDASGLDAPFGTPRTTVTLRRGKPVGQGLQVWRSQGCVPPKDGVLVMVDLSGVEKGRWKFQGGRISSWVGPALNAKGGDVAITALELTCERMEEQ